MLKSVFLFLTLCICWSGRSQEPQTEVKQINIVYGGTFTKDEKQYPGAAIFSKDGQQVQMEHAGADLWCDIAIYYQKENRLKAIGNIKLQQGDSVQLTSGKIDYDGNLNLAKAWENVVLNHTSMTLTTDTLRFDREKQEAYYEHNGTVVDSSNTLTSKIGRYFTQLKKSQFLQSVNLVNPEFNLESKQLDYYTESKNAYLYGASTITGETYKMYCERGFYDTKIENGYGIKNTRIDYNNRIITGDSLYFDKKTEFASATNNITIRDTINNGLIRAHYAEVYKAKDSVFATKRAVSINLVEQDSLYMHGDTLMITGKPEQRILRAFRNAKFYKTDLSGKCDSIHFNQKTGITELITNPIIWNGENQMTGDSIHLLSNLETEKLDSLKVINNAFIISLDTVGKVGYNQAKGKDLFGKFIDNKLSLIDLVKNTEVIYYMYNDDQELIGIDKTICSAIRMTLANNEIEDITFITMPDGDIFPEKELPENSRLLKGFIWRGKERIMTKDDIFDEDDNNIKLVTIRGVDNPIDLDVEPEEALEDQRKRDSINTSKLLPPNPLKKLEPTKKDPQQKEPKPSVSEIKTGVRYEEGAKENGLDPGYYLIANVFEVKENYEKFMKSLTKKGLEPQHFLRNFNQYHYVYLERYNTWEEALQSRNSNFNGKYLDDTWIFRVLDK
ncbi:OstA-like protein [Arenibacter troitsensis]|uniref:OstA-like protein n=1 Tax=Arenibacter troitsensis TaxID=188872 RepID=A0A1X7LDI8_9FLAO|nr:OstA-like protein [Arenibacter troitsensis]